MLLLQVRVLSEKKEMTIMSNTEVFFEEATDIQLLNYPHAYRLEDVRVGQCCILQIPVIDPETGKLCPKKVFGKLDKEFDNGMSLYSTPIFGGTVAAFVYVFKGNYVADEYRKDYNLSIVEGKFEFRVEWIVDWELNPIYSSNPDYLQVTKEFYDILASLNFIQKIKGIEDCIDPKEYLRKIQENYPGVKVLEGEDIEDTTTDNF